MKPGTLTAKQCDGLLGVLIHDSDGKHIAASVTLPLGVPPDGSTVAAEGFVIGAASGRGKWTRHEDGSISATCSDLEPALMDLQPGQSREFSFVPLPVPVETKPEESDVQQTSATGRHDYDLLREEAADRGGYRIEEAPNAGRCLVWDGDDVIAKFWKREHADIFVAAMEADNARLMADIDAAPSAPVAESGGPRFPKPIQWASTNPEHWHTFLCNVDGEIDFYLSEDRMLITTSCDKSTHGMMDVADLEAWVERGGDSRWLVALERARQLGLIEAGPRWKVLPSEWTELREFIGSFGHLDFYVAFGGWVEKKHLIASVGENGCIYTMSLPDGSPLAENGANVNAKNLAEYMEATYLDATDAKLYRTAYDTALAANQLPPHPRYPKPEGATDFLGWFGEAPDGSECDGWWNGSDVCVVCSSFGMGWRKLESARLMPRLYAIAAARAIELGLPERDARKAKLADIDRKIAALTAERAGIESEVGT